VPKSVPPLRYRLAAVILLFSLLLLLGACEEKPEPPTERREEIKGEIREEIREKLKEPMGIITTTNYCQGKITAADLKLKPGHIALSRDLERKHHLKFGDLIYLEDETEPYVFVDRMPRRWKSHADLYSRRCRTAKEYGVQTRKLWFVRN
jgi:hypothetical protein